MLWQVVFFFIWIVQPSEWVRSSNESPKSCLFCNSVIYLFSLIIITKMLWISFILLDWCKRDNTFYCMDFSIQFFFTFLISGFWYIQLYSFIFLVMLPNFWMPWWVGVCGELYQGGDNSTFLCNAICWIVIIHIFV